MILRITWSSQFPSCPDHHVLSRKRPKQYKLIYYETQKDSANYKQISFMVPKGVNSHIFQLTSTKQPSSVIGDTRLHLKPYTVYKMCLKYRKPFAVSIHQDPWSECSPYTEFTSPSEEPKPLHLIEHAWFNSSGKQIQLRLWEVVQLHSSQNFTILCQIIHCDVLLEEVTSFVLRLVNDRGKHSSVRVKYNPNMGRIINFSVHHLPAYAIDKVRISLDRCTSGGCSHTAPYYRMLIYPNYVHPVEETNYTTIVFAIVGVSLALVIIVVVAWISLRRNQGRNHQLSRFPLICRNHQPSQDQVPPRDLEEQGFEPQYKEENQAIFQNANTSNQIS